MLYQTRAAPTHHGPSQSNILPRRRHVRRGTTLMEYLMMLSLIVTVALVGIGYFGQMTNNVATAASTAISKSVKKSS